MANKILIDSGSSGRGWSYYGLWILCPQKWARRYRPFGGGVFPPPVSVEDIDQETVAFPLRKGSTLHAGMAHHYHHLLSDVSDKDRESHYTALEALQVAAKKYALDIGTTADLTTIYKAYCKHYQYDPWEPLFVEKLYSFNINGRHLYTMRVDLVYKENGKIHFADHKSSFKVTDASATKYQLSGQFVAGELIGRKIYGTDWGGMTVNFLPSILGRGDLSSQFKRLRMPPIPGMTLDVFRRTIVRAAEQIAHHDNAKTPVLEYPRSMHENICVTAYGPCEHLDSCSWDLAMPLEVADESNNDL